MLSTMRRSLTEGASAAVRRYQWERIQQLLPAEFDAAWQAAGGVPGWFEQRQAAAFTLALQALPPDPTVVEIGSYLGRSAVFQARILSALGRGGRVTAIDPHTGDRQHLERLGLDELPTWDLFRYFVRSLDPDRRIDMVRATSMEAARDWGGGRIDLLYIDGWHAYEAVMEDGQHWLPRLADAGIVVFDDYGSYADDVARAVDDLAAEGLFVPWGVNARQMIGGRGDGPPAPLDELLSIVESGTMHRLATVRDRLTKDA
ncbi:hypothetical protein GCM10022242_20530 [Nocardioides panacisoli]|uniref:Class I SAM-dependent methyltransferase n=2 Tax=Nocardioides panacisoli TaxID=627624 RepID=A0ABP7IHJ3_9ACTN